MEQNTLTDNKDLEIHQTTPKNSQKNSQTDSVKLNSDHSTTVTDTSKINNIPSDTPINNPPTTVVLINPPQSNNEPINEKMDENEEADNSI